MNLGLTRVSLYVTLKAEFIKGKKKINRSLSKLKIFMLSEIHLQKWRQTIYRKEKVCKSHVSDKGLVSRIYKGSYKSITRRQIT